MASKSCRLSGRGDRYVQWPPAPLLYVSSTQINALIPARRGSRSVEVVAQVNGVSSSPFVITAKATQPAVYAPPNAGGSSFFVTAALDGTASLVGNSAIDPRVARRVYPGDILDFYMIGLGYTVDHSKFVSDTVFSGAFPVSAPVSVIVGGKAANVAFAGLTGPGLYLVRGHGAVRLAGRTANDAGLGRNDSQQTLAGASNGLRSAALKDDSRSSKPCKSSLAQDCYPPRGYGRATDRPRRAARLTYSAVRKNLRAKPNVSIARLPVNLTRPSSSESRVIRPEPVIQRHGPKRGPRQS